jgi:uncharacterized OsmC-like protein
MSELTLAYQARCYSSARVGRAICNARHHHWVADDSGGEAVGAGELFCASLSACAVNMVEKLAKQAGTQLGGMQVTAQAYRDMDKAPGDLTLYDAVRIHFEMSDVATDVAEQLVKTWKSR